jgi:[acyl-carrier-protein] S-malonyltransferase
MGRELFEAYPESRAVFEEADRALDRPLSSLCFEGSAEDLALTENTQPTILTVSIAALRALERSGVRPCAAAGHSLGEYSAHVAAETLSFSDAVRTVRMRGRFMQEAVPVGEGAMAAVLGLGPERVTEMCESCADGEVVGAANLNGPRQVVVAGHTGAVERVAAAAREAGARRVVRLPVSAPFHCSLMQPAASRLQPLLEALDLRDPAFPVFCNADAAAVERADAAREALIRQVASPVRWHESVEAMLAVGVEAFVEVGPGKVLSGLVRGVRKGVPTFQVSDPDGVQAVVEAWTS